MKYFVLNISLYLLFCVIFIIAVVGTVRLWDMSFGYACLYSSSGSSGTGVQARQWVISGFLTQLWNDSLKEFSEIYRLNEPSAHQLQRTHKILTERYNNYMYGF